MTDYIIRPITEKDVEGFRDSVDYVAREKKYLAFFEAPPLEISRAFVLDNIENKNPQFVVEAEGRIVGWCDVVRKELPIYSHTGVLGIGLLPVWRGRGIGRQLMQKTIDAAIEQGFTRIELGVRAHNKNAQHLYESLGFFIEGLKRRECKVNGVYEDSYIMSLLVDKAA